MEVHKINNDKEYKKNLYFDKNSETNNNQFCTNNDCDIIEKDYEEEAKVFSCETLRMCIITTLNWGLRNGGGIGDVLRNVDPEVYFFL